MSETITETDPDLILIDELADFTKHSLMIVEESRRELLILSKTLDPALYNNDDFYHRLLNMARADRESHVKIMVKDFHSLEAHGHQILDLSRRLPSKIEIRHLKVRPSQDEIAFIIGDHKHLLFMHEDGVYNGAVNYDSEDECNELVREFNQLWKKHCDRDPAVNSMLI